MGNRHSKKERLTLSHVNNKFEVSNPSQSIPQVRVRALHSFAKCNPNDLSFSKGDAMIVCSNLSDPWLYAMHVESQKYGFIPGNYVVIDDGSPTSLECWFDIGRLQAEKNLILPGYTHGTFILRPSSKSGNYALSIRYLDKKKDFFIVRHYKIQMNEKGAYFIVDRNLFPDVKSLIAYYQLHSDGLCCRLSDPFPKGERPPIQFREIEVNRNCLSMERKLGSGNFGDVWLAKWNNKIDVAVKQLKQTHEDIGQRQCCLEEAKLMHQLRHPRIVEILGVCSEPINEPVFIITEVMINGALLDFLREDCGKIVNFDDMILMMHQIADGMSYLESKNFIHRDLRAANILVGDGMSVKVADFGLARMIEDVYEAKTSKFPVKWTSPEAGLRQIFSTKSDVWSFGVVMYEIVTYGKSPYSNISVVSVLDAIDKGYRLERPANDNFMCPVDLYTIMLSCWDAKPDSRPTFVQLKEVFDNFTYSL